MVDEVVAGERVDELAVAAPVRGRDRHELAVACRGGERVRARQQPLAVGGEERRGDEGRRLVAGARRLDYCCDRRRVSQDEPVDEGHWRHATTVASTAD